MTKEKENINKKPKEEPRKPEPWIPMRSGLIVIAVTSIGMFVLTAWQVTPVKGIGQGILWGLFYGGLFWVLFLGLYAIQRLLRR